MNSYLFINQTLCTKINKKQEKTSLCPQQNLLRQRTVHLTRSCLLFKDIKRKQIILLHHIKQHKAIKVRWLWRRRLRLKKRVSRLYTAVNFFLIARRFGLKVESQMSIQSSAKSQLSDKTAPIYQFISQLTVKFFLPILGHQLKPLPNPVTSLLTPRRQKLKIFLFPLISHYIKNIILFEQSKHETVKTKTIHRPTSNYC